MPLTKTQLEQQINALFPTNKAGRILAPNMREYADTGVITYSSAAYGGVRQSTPVGLPDINATFQTIPADSGSIAAPLGINQDFAKDGVEFEGEGVFQGNIGITLSHNEVNAGRVIQIRLFNATDLQSSIDTVVGTGRNTSVTNINFSSLVNISASSIGDLYVVQISSADSYSSVQLESYSFTVAQISEPKG